VARRFLTGAWVVFAGDSILRLLFAALLRLLTTDGSEQVLFGHRVRVATPPATPPFLSKSAVCCPAHTLHGLQPFA
jgi:hypothetical protein